MSMPGFVYHFSCPQCGRHSDEYPAFVFPNTFDGSMLLPAWSRELQCYGSIGCDLSWEDRERLGNNHEAQVSLAARLTSAAMTVGVPTLRVEEDGKAVHVDVTPHPDCPYCSGRAEVRFGYPPGDKGAPPEAERADE